MGPIPAYTAPTSAPDGGGSACRSADRRDQHPVRHRAVSATGHRGGDQRMTSKRYRGLAMLGVLAIAATACGGSTASGTPAASAAPASAGTSAAPASQAPAAGGDFTFVVDSEPTTLAGAAGRPADVVDHRVHLHGAVSAQLQGRVRPAGRRRPARHLGRRPDLDRQDQAEHQVPRRQPLDRRRRQVHVRPARPRRTAA